MRKRKRCSHTRCTYMVHAYYHYYHYQLSVSHLLIQSCPIPITITVSNQRTKYVKCKQAKASENKQIYL